MSKRYFEFIGTDERRGTDSAKFWEVTVDGATITVRFGKIGADGQVKETTFATVEDAEAEAAKLIASKVKKGYSERSA